MRLSHIGLAMVLAVATWSCSEPEDDDPPECGNGLIETGEQCDGSAIDEFSCEDIGLGHGMVTCNDQCHWEFTGCTTPPTCGNEVRDMGEACDGTDLGDLACTDLGYDAGEMTCLPGCLFDLSACCVDTCETGYDTRCEGEVVQTCTMQASGCLGWEDTEDCATGSPDQECDDTGTPAECVLSCTNACNTMTELSCTDDATGIQTCTMQTTGCLDWNETEDCMQLSASAFCDDTGSTPVCQPCRNDCFSVGARTCDGDLLQVCVEVVTGCSEWQTYSNCALLGQYCGECGVEDPLSCLSGC